ncbi:Holliday junction branch migration protein RuvA [Shouchella shacheensis]|uniref:Holliday junction branch migration protein RuvA n=1 Tax=Shouchella shacheensis TaxID=1649580 RepID=UPI00073FAF49|nr:Holliday junction branch migration protein RuvA [Shouchella shacheensis]
MIDYVRGTLKRIESDFIVIDVGGVGYQVYCANPYRFTAEQEKDVQIQTHHYVREDTQRLYGFASFAERTLFEKLLGVSGIGPKGALAILASGQPEDVIQAIEEEDEALLVRFPGVGKKTARQIILDLKGKLELAPNVEGESSGTASSEVKKSNHSLEDALEALRALGYVEKELKKVKPTLELETMDTDAYVKRALQLLLKR